MAPLELLAPARTADIGIAAIRCGADAVYIGGPSFGARAAAGNSIEDIRRLCRFASGFGVRIFVTVNTLARDEAERREAVGMMLSMKDIGISAFIIQDTSLMPLLWAAGPWKEEFHASTQCAIRTPERALQLVGLGFSRLILERQLSLEQIRAIRKAVPDSVELEAFVHGALCVCYSGDCYLSEYLTGRSANRGECAQPCRNLYDLVDGTGKVLVGRKPLLSLRDLSLADRLRDLVDAGITSFKIEGRLKGESYVKNVVRAYSDMLDGVIAGVGSSLRRASWGHVSGGFTPNLDKTFNRGYTSLFLDGVRGKWNSGDAAGGLGEPIGKFEGASGRKELTIELLNGISLHNGDGLCHVNSRGEIVGFRIEKVIREGRENRGGPSRFAQILVAENVQMPRPGSKIWRNFDCEFERELEKNMPSRLLSAKLSLSFTYNCAQHPDWILRSSALREDGVCVEKDFDLSGLPLAQNQARMREMILAQLSKKSDSLEFTIDNLAIEGSLPLMSAAFLNSVRRDLAAEFAEIPVRATTGRQSVNQILKSQTVHEQELAALTHPRRDGELMRSKYCIRAELGMCLKNHPLFLKNNGKTFPIHFDCTNCEMVIFFSHSKKN